MSLPSKKTFFEHIRLLYGTEYCTDKGYDFLLRIINNKEDEEYMSYLQELIGMSIKQKYEYRNILAENGTELTPKQLDQKLFIIQYALNHIYS